MAPYEVTVEVTASNNDKLNFFVMFKINYNISFINRPSMKINYGNITSKAHFHFLALNLVAPKFLHRSNF